MKISSLNNSGFSVLEVVIALGIGTMALVASAYAFAGVQDSYVRGMLYTQAILDLEKTLIGMYASSTTHFYDTVSFERLYTYATESVSVVDISPCAKYVSALYEWNDYARTSYVSLETYLSHSRAVRDLGEMCDTTYMPKNSWDQYDVTTFNTPFGPASDIDVVGEYIIVSYNSTSSDEADIRIFNRDNPEFLIAEYDSGSGIVAIDVAFNTVFAATMSTSTQFVSVDISDPSEPYIASAMSLYGVDPFGSFPQGRSIYFFDNTVYLGTKETFGPELHVFDVSNTHAPFEMSNEEVTHNLHDISVRWPFVYLATSADTQELIVAEMTDEGGVEEVGVFNAGVSAAHDKDATVVYHSGNVMYLGRKRGGSNQDELYAVDVSDPYTPVLLWSFNIDTNKASSYVSGIHASSGFLFVSTTDELSPFLILDISKEPVVVAVVTTPPIVAFDVSDGFVYAVDVSGRLHVVQPSYE